MNQGYYRPPTTSRASATTKCQKCLKLDIYECKAKPEERPYAARPSRTAQLKNPKLAPKLTSDVPNDLLRKKGTADEILAAKVSERGRKRSRSVESGNGKLRRGGSRSMSTSSVSTISTAASRSASPLPRRRHSVAERDDADGDRHMTSQNIREAPRKRPRRSVSASTNSSNASHSDRNTRRRRKSKSPTLRGRRRSRSPGRNGRSRSRSITHHATRKSFEGGPPTARDGSFRSGGPVNGHVNGNGHGGGQRNRPAPSVPKERSMSPYSKRLALTQTMNER